MLSRSPLITGLHVFARRHASQGTIAMVLLGLVALSLSGLLGVRVGPTLAVAGAHGRAVQPGPSATAAHALLAGSGTTSFGAMEHYTGNIQLAPSACAMAHCDPRLSDVESIIVPTSGVTVAWTFPLSKTIAGVSLGCTVGTTFAACVTKNPSGSQAYGLPYMYALDPATGQPLWNSGASVNGSVNSGAPLIDAAGNSYVSDRNYLVSFDVTGTVRWRVSNPAQASLVSFNVTDDGHLVGQGTKGPVLVVDPTSGKVTGSLLLTGTVGGVSGTFVTTNTVSVAGNRLYTLTEFCPNQNCANVTAPLDRLYAIDVVNGVPQVAWHWDFAGPSSTSPLTIITTTANMIYFAGAGNAPGDPQHNWLFALQDQGSQAALLWAVDFTVAFGIPYIHGGIPAAAVRDPRGGVWEWLLGDSRLFRFGDLNGKLLQTIDLSAIQGQPGYAPGGTPCIATNGSHPTLFVGSANRQTQSDPTYVDAVDLTSGTLLWKLDLGTTSGPALPGLLPIAQTAAGPVIVTEGGTAIYGLALDTSRRHTP